MSGHFIKHWLLEAYWTSSIGSVAQSAPSITLQITGAFFHFPPSIASFPVAASACTLSPSASIAQKVSHC